MTTHKITILNNGDRGVRRDYWATCQCGWTQLHTDPPIHVIDFEADTSTLADWKAEARAEAKVYGNQHLDDALDDPEVDNLTAFAYTPDAPPSAFHPGDKRRAEALTLLKARYEAANGDSNDAEVQAGFELAEFVAVLFGVTEAEIEGAS